MRNSAKSPVQGVRQDKWSGTKWSKTMPFNPWYSIIDKKKRQWKSLDDCAASKKPFILVEPATPGFIIPCTKEDIQETISCVPSEFLKDLTAIVVIGGSRKLNKAERKYVYGTYYQNWIFLAGYPEKWMICKWSKGITPNELIQYRNVGVKVEEIKGGIHIVFDLESLKRFYLQNVLIHEIAHHIDTDFKSSTIRKRENFAKWFATEYGYRLRLSSE